MLCPGCSVENPPAAKFCSNCGSGLAAACAGCGHLNPRTSRFCAECGGPLAAPALEPRFTSPQQYTPPPLAEKIRSSRPAMEGEYKQITVLSADVAGFTPLAESLDPEECYALMQRCFDLMLTEVHRYEGTVTQFLGDGILALFGAPIAHEEHAQRAVRAALGIQEALRAYQQELQESRGIQFRMRIGLNSGLVVVGTIGTDLNMTYTAIGDTVNLASRVQGLAEPGTVVISENTQRLVSGYFETRALGQHRVKGKARAVTAYEVLRPRRWRSRVEVSAEQGLTPLVGRQSQLALLLDRFAAAGAGHGQIVLVRGEAGIGKSRLLYEFKHRLEADALTWVEGRCISFGREIAYFPIIDLIKELFEIEETDSEAEIARKIETGVGAHGERLAGSRPLLKYLLAVDPGDPTIATMDRRVRKLRVFEAVHALLTAAATVSPLVVSMEDLHWIDPLSEELLFSFTAVVPQYPILLLLTARRGYEPRFGAPTGLTALDLQSLSERESGEVARGLLRADPLPEDLKELIHRKAEGNPFFVEEVTKSLLEEGAIRRDGAGYHLTRRIEEIYVPDTVQDVIMTRLDRLPEEPKRALQTAAVIGREFPVRLLERTAELRGRLDQYLSELKALELIYERSLSPELAYMFKHALTHDVAYQSLLLARRRVLHRLVAAAIEELYREHLGEQYEVLAYHYEQAEVWEKVLKYLQKSGEKALAAFAPQQAISFYDRALAAAAKSGRPLAPEQLIALLFGRGQALFDTNNWDDSTASFQAMLAAAQSAGDRAHEGLALCKLGEVAHWAHRLEEAREYAHRAHQFAVETGSDTVLATSLMMIAGTHLVVGDLQSTRRAAEESLQVATRAGIPIVQGWMLNVLGALQHFEGDDWGALEAEDEAVRIGRQLQEGIFLNHALVAKGMCHCSRGEYDQAIATLKENFEFATRINDPIHRCRALNILGWVYMDLCHWDLAVQYNRQGAAEARVIGDPDIIRNPEINLGNCSLVLGQLQEARRILEDVYTEVQRADAPGDYFMKWRYTQYLYASLGDLWLALGDPEKAIGFADICLAAARAQNARRNIVKGRRVRGQAFLMQGKLDEAKTELEDAVRMAREVGNPAQLWQTLAALARLRHAQGRSPEALGGYQEAVAIMEGMASGLSDPALRDTLLASPQLRSLREAVALG